LLAACHGCLLEVMQEVGDVLMSSLRVVVALVEVNTVVPRASRTVKAPASVTCGKQDRLQVITGMCDCAVLA
jgi:hypothetical protein